MVLFPSVALAATDVNAPAHATPAWVSSHHDDPEPPTPPAAASRVRTLLCALMVMSLIGFAIYTKVKKKTLTAKNPTAYVKVSDSVKVGEKAHLVVATIGSRTMVLGVTEHGIRRIIDVDRASETKVTTAAAKASLRSERDEKTSGSGTDDDVIGSALATGKTGKVYADKASLSSLKARFQTLLRDARGTDVEEEDDTANLPGAVSQPMLRVANDTQDRFERRSSGSHATDPLGVEEQVSGLLTRRARRT